MGGGLTPHVDAPHVVDDHRSHVVKHFLLHAQRADEADPHCVVTRLAILHGI
jgi:hypothetical protein